MSLRLRKRVVMQLVTIPNDSLNRECSEIKPSEASQYEDIASEMIDIMAESNGIGLAAPQVGIDKRLIVFFGTISEEGHGDPVVMINPEITELSGELVTEIEGCLSVPIFRVPVERPSHVCVTALDVRGNRFEYQADGFVAKCIQHEIDHLNGITLLEHLDDATESRCVVVPNSYVGLEESEDDEFPFVVIKVDGRADAIGLYDDVFSEEAPDKRFMRLFERLVRRGELQFDDQGDVDDRAASEETVTENDA